MKPFITALILICVTSLALAEHDASNFFATPETILAELSPDGKGVVVIRNNAEGQQILLLDTLSKRKRVLLDLAKFSEKDATINRLSWIDNSHLAAQFFSVKAGVEDLLDTKRSSYLLIIKVPQTATESPQILSVRTRGWLVDSLPHKNDSFLYAKSGPYSKVYEIKASQLSAHKQRLNKLTKIDNGQFTKANEVASTKGYATRWFIGKEDVPVAVMNYTEKSEFSLNMLSADGESKQLKTWSSQSKSSANKTADEESKRIIPIAIADEKNSFYCLDFDEDEERTVYKINYDSGKKTVVYEADSYKIIDLLISYPDNKLIGVKTLKEGQIHYSYLNQNEETSSESEKLFHSAMLLSVVGSSTDNKISLLYSEAHNKPGTYIIKNNNTGTKRTIGSHFPHLNNKLNSRQIESHIGTDELAIPYILTLPASKFRAPFPLIVYPHGGPIGIFDHKYFDAGTQFFAANGYAVLRVNFRGSSGFSEALKDAGKKQWGDLVLTDIFRATQQASENELIDANRVCILGMSYGGYAATMLTIKHPEVYKCAVSVAGVSDLNLYLNSTRAVTNHDEWLKEHVGDAVKDYDQLKAISSVYRAHELQRPIFIMHGEKDQIVSVEHSYRLKLILNKYNKPYSWHTYPELGHSISGVEHQIDLFKKAKAFIDEQINLAVNSN